MWFLTCMPNFSSLAWIEVCQEPPVLEAILVGREWFLTGYLEAGVILDIMDHHDMWLLTCVSNFSILAWIKVCQEPPILEVHTWRTLMVPDWRLGGWRHCWHHGLSWYVIFYLCTIFHISSMIRSASRTNPSSKSYLEDAEGSWLETGRVGSSLTSWIILICDSWLVYQISAL